MPFTPTEDELTQALVDLKSRDPQLGIAKVHALLLKNYPDWGVSEKRTRKILQLQGLIVSSSSPTASANEPPVFPTSRVMDQLDVKQWSDKVQVKFFNKKKGKGLVAATDLEEGDTIWKEEPFVVAPEWEIYDMQRNSTACGYCTTPLVLDSPLINVCPSSSSAMPAATMSTNPCPTRFCSRLCMARSAKVHPLLCQVQNPACAPLLKFSRDSQWMALHALVHTASRILLANQHGVETLRKDWDIVQSLAELGMEERFKYSFKSSAAPEPDRTVWKKAYNLYLQAFKEPKSPQDQKKLAKLLKKSLPAEVEHGLFDYDAGFLRGLGRMSLNLESHGGLYVLHSHLNHSCEPNVSVRHLDTRNALSRITILAKRAIKQGEELTVTYVNPKLGYTARQHELRGWGFGSCVCARCVEEEKMARQAPPGNGGGEGGGVDDLDDLASELKAGLGVM